MQQQQQQQQQRAYYMAIVQECYLFIEIK